jgi:hypothetical protein
VSLWALIRFVAETMLTPTTAPPTYLTLSGEYRVSGDFFHVFFEHNIRGGGTTTSVWLDASKKSRVKLRFRLEEEASEAMRAIMVRVLPRPMGSAMMPPQKSSGSSSWCLPDMRLTKLL